MEYEAVIGLEVHAEMATNSKMFCACLVVDSTQAAPNSAVCPVCCGLPGVLPVVNRQAVAYGMRVALALGCTVAERSIFDRKNYFYPDLPKGYQISQFEFPLAEKGTLTIHTSQGEKVVRVTRTHLEEDAGKLTHVEKNGETYSLVDLNRAGVPLLEIVSEPDMRSAEEACAYGEAIRAIVRYLGVNSGDMQKGVIRFEANISIRPLGSTKLGTRTEVKNLNSFRAMERAINYEIKRQAVLLDAGQPVLQETLGWDETNEVTFSQRSKEEAHDYRYFPDPDLPPLVISPEWIAEEAAKLPELPRQKYQRLLEQYQLSEDDAYFMVSTQEMADYFEATVKAAGKIPAKITANWMTGEMAAWLNQDGKSLSELKVTPAILAELMQQVESSVINLPTAKKLYSEMAESGKSAKDLIAAQGLQQISDEGAILAMINEVLEANPTELQSFLDGKETLSNWFFGQVMRLAKGKANPGTIRSLLETRLNERKTE
ncbi:MAG: Asp-tRNA(Asn)/Glu-tRNA(Gln) amidotransferase subunit GatB [Anaerolineaceae bacterium]|nr:Asp-tRNA(Asn)/Glu-tRNA(Gln) amidotransferase subunit GatB [Anaerolineaceae bacterium]